MMAPKHKSNDAGNSDMPNKCCKVYVCVGKKGIYMVQYCPQF